MKRQKKNPNPEMLQGFRLWLGIGGLFALVGGLIYFYYPWESPISETPTPQNLGRGAQLFAQHCAQCHGPAGIGENPQQARGGMKADGSYLAPALNGTGHTWHHPTGMLFNIIKNGSRAENSAMRGFKGRLKDEEIHTVIKYLKSLWPEKIRKHYEKMSQ